MSAKSVKVTIELVLSVNDTDDGDPAETATWSVDDLRDVITEEVDSLTFWVPATLNVEHDTEVDFDVLESKVIIQDLVTA